VEYCGRFQSAAGTTLTSSPAPTALKQPYTTSCRCSRQSVTDRKQRKRSWRSVACAGWFLCDLGKPEPGKARSLPMTHWPLACCGQIIDDQQIPTYTRPFALSPKPLLTPSTYSQSYIVPPALHIYFFPSGSPHARQLSLFATSSGPCVKNAPPVPETLCFQGLI
jgi:hypothetical protein